ncbi:hypothetical protein M0802_003360 [Mischocyttarus mexicanus]|nr:hypothetical protein M0802_003360 [Mischocyttarus mexicanus]
MAGKLHGPATDDLLVDSSGPGWIAATSDILFESFLVSGSNTESPTSPVVQGPHGSGPKVERDFPGPPQSPRSASLFLGRPTSLNSFQATLFNSHQETRLVDPHEESSIRYVVAIEDVSAALCRRYEHDGVSNLLPASFLRLFGSVIAA